MKISIIGAGSMFTRALTVDILTIEGLEEGVFALVDIDPKRLELAHKLVEMVIAKTGKNWKVISSTDRREVIADSDFVINQIEVSGLETVRLDYEIPLKYGVKQCIGDTLGPGRAVQNPAHPAGLDRDRTGHRRSGSGCDDPQLHQPHVGGGPGYHQNH